MRSVLLICLVLVGCSKPPVPTPVASPIVVAPPPVAPAAEPAPPDPWKTASNVVHIGELKVTASLVVPCRVVWKGGSEREDDMIFMGVDLLIENLSATNRVRYFGSNSTVEIPPVIDEHGNDYRSWNLVHRNLPQHKDGIEAAVINPGESIRDRFVFDNPIDVSKKFLIKIPGAAVRLDEPLQFVLTRS